MLVQDFCPLKIKITQFPDGFHLKLSVCLNILSGNEKKKCHCGAKNCSSFLGVRPKNQVQEEKSKKPVDKRKKKRIKKTVVKEGKWMFLLHLGVVLLKVICELMQQDSRKMRTAKCLCMTNC